MVDQVKTAGRAIALPNLLEVKMKLEDIILVTDNDKGTETNFLCTFKDYMKEFICRSYEDALDVANMGIELENTRHNHQDWSESYQAANKSIYARYCTSKSQLQIFLVGKYNDGKAEFSVERSSRECLEVLERLGIGINGGMLNGVFPHYEKLEKNYVQGEILHNFNGSDYRVMEKLSDRNLLLMDVSQGNFIVGIDVGYFARYPKEENANSELCEKAIEWQHGVYLGSTPSEIDFKAIRREYGKEEQIKDNSGKTMIYEVEIEERLSRVIDIKADSMDEAVDIAREKYYDEEIVLDAEDMKGVEFKEHGCRELQKEKIR